VIPFGLATKDTTANCPSGQRLTSQEYRARRIGLQGPKPKHGEELPKAFAGRSKHSRRGLRSALSVGAPRGDARRPRRAFDLRFRFLLPQRYPGRGWRGPRPRSEPLIQSNPPFQDMNKSAVSQPPRAPLRLERQHSAAPSARETRPSAPSRPPPRPLGRSPTASRSVATRQLCTRSCVPMSANSSPTSCRSSRTAGEAWRSCRSASGATVAGSSGAASPAAFAA
jgi:hypothetical protein